ncbi:MAG: tetratricopeptide repeat protein [Candidatus Kapabacteria bacterium]|nr:tetratricopeptide repeat protein [Candidatus Kapabacteria bacterium]
MADTITSKTSFVKKFFRKNEDGTWFFVWNAHQIDKEIHDAIERSIAAAVSAASDAHWHESLSHYRKVLLLDENNENAASAIRDILLNHVDAKNGIAFCIDILKSRKDLVPMYVLLSTVYRAAGHTDKAQKAMKRCIEVNGQSWQALCELAAVQLQSGMITDAEKSVASALKTAPDVIQVHLVHVAVALQKKEWEKAIDIAKAAFRFDMKNPALFTQLGIAQYNAGKFTDAYFTLAEAIALNGTNLQALYYAGLSAYKSKNYKESLRFLKLAEAIDSSYDYVQYYLAAVYALQQQYEQAAQHITKQMSNGDMTKEMLDYAGKILEFVGDYQGGIALQYKLLDGSNDDAATYTRIGDLEMRLGNLIDAHSAYTAATNKVPRFARAHSGLGDVYVKQAKMDEAMQEYHIAIECDATLFSAYVGLADAYRLLGDTTEALRYIKIAIDIDAKNPDAMFMYGLIMESLDKSNEAISAYTMTLRFKPTNEEACFRRACLYERNGDYAKAIQSFKNVLVINPRSAEAYFHLATTQVAIARFNAAHDSFQEAVRLLPDSEAMYIGFGMAMERAFQREKALDVYKQAVQQNDSFVNALYQVGRLSHELGYISYTMDVQEKLDFTAPELARKLRILREQTEMMRSA